MAQPLSIDVLVVDDEEPVAELLLEVLRDEGLSAVSVGDGRRVLEAVRQYRPRLILLDVMLPGLSGPQVLQRLLATAPPHPAVVLMSAAGLPANRPPRVPFLAKPFNIDELLGIVHATLERS